MLSRRYIGQLNSTRWHLSDILDVIEIRLFSTHRKIENIMNDSFSQ